MCSRKQLGDSMELKDTHRGYIIDLQCALTCNVHRVAQLLLPAAQLLEDREAQIDQNDQIIETRIAVAKRSGALENPDLETALILRNGKEFLLQEETINGQRRAWVVKARIVAIPDDAWEELGR